MSTPDEIARRIRHREARKVGCVLREYTVVLYTISESLCTYLGSADARKSGVPSPFPRQHYIHICRVQSIASSVEIFTQTASQMMVHYDLDPIAKSELTLRLRDAEIAILFAVDSAKKVAESRGHPYPMNLPPPIPPTPPGLESIVNTSKKYKSVLE
jgi:hypothetical protein